MNISLYTCLIEKVLTNEKWHYRIILSAVVVLFSLLFVSNKFEQTASGSLLFSSNYPWYSLINAQRNEEEAYRTIKYITERSEASGARNFRIAKDVLQITLGKQFVFTSYVVNTGEHLKISPDSNCYSKQCVYFNERRRNEISEYLIRNNNFIQFDGEKYHFGGFYKSSDGIDEPDMVLVAPRKFLPGAKYSVTAAVIIGGMNVSRLSVLIEDIYSSLRSNLSISVMPYQVLGVFTSQFEHQAITKFSELFAHSKIYVKICLLVLLFVLSYMMVMSFQKDIKNISLLGVTKYQYIKMSGSLSFVLVYKMAFLSAIIALALQLLTQFLSLTFKKVVIAEGVIEFYLQYFFYVVPLSIVFVLLSVFLCSLGFFWARMGNGTSNAASNIKFYIVNMISILTCCFILFFSFGKITDFQVIVDQLNSVHHKNIALIELSNEVLNINNIGERVNAGSVDALVGTLESMKREGLIHNYSLSSMYPFFSGGSVQKYQVDGKIIHLNVNKISGDYFGILKGESDSDRDVHYLSGYGALLIDKRLHAIVVESQTKTLRQELTTISSGNKIETKLYDVNYKVYDGQPLPYVSIFNDQDIIAYSKLKNSVDLQFISLDVKAVALSTVIERIKISLPTRISVSKLHDFSDVVSNNIIGYVFTLLYSIIMVFISVFFIVFSSKNATVGYLSYISKDINTILMIGGNRKQCFSHVLKAARLPVLGVFVTPLIVFMLPINHKPSDEFWFFYFFSTATCLLVCFWAVKNSIEKDVVKYGYCD